MIPVVYAEGEYYHIFNRGVARQPIFKTRRDYLRAITAIDFYRFLTPPLRLSKALLLELVLYFKERLKVSGLKLKSN